MANKQAIRFLGRERETDEALRERAKKALLASGRASTTSIENALLGMPGVREVRVREDLVYARVTTAALTALQEAGLETGLLDKLKSLQDQPFTNLDDLERNLKRLLDAAPYDANKALILEHLRNTRYLGPGVVEVYVDGLRPENARALNERIEEVRAAGVYLTLNPAVALSLEAVLQIEIDAGIHAEERQALEQRVRDGVVHFIDRLRMGQPLLFSQLTTEVLNIKGVTDLSDFEIVAFQEAETFAEGAVTLTRSAGEILSIPARTLLRTQPGQEFLTVKDVQIDPGDVQAMAEVRAVKAGRAGELFRTGSAITWEIRTVQTVALSIENEAPIALARTRYGTLGERPDKRIDVDILERFVPESVRVASETKALNVHVQVQVTFPDDDARQAVVDAIRAKIESYKSAVPLTDGELANITDPTTRTAVNDGLTAFVDGVVEATGTLLSKLALGLHQSTQGDLIQAIQAYFDGQAQKIQISELWNVIDQILQAIPSDDSEASIKVRFKPVLKDVLNVFLENEMASFPDQTLVSTIDAELERVFQAGIDTASQALATAMQAELQKLNAGNLTQTEYVENQRLHQQAFNDEQKRLQQNLARDRDQLGAQAAALKTKVETALTPLLDEATLTELLGAVTSPTPYRFAPRLVVYPFQRPRRADVAVVEASFVERLVAEVLFVYSVEVEVTGTLRLVLSLTASMDQKRTVKGDVRQAIEDYLDLLKPEEDVDLTQIRAFAIGHEQVLRVEYKPEACGLVAVAPDGTRLALPDRNQGESMSIEAFEKVFLSKDQFVMKA